MKRDTTLSESVLLDHVRRLPHARASTKQLIREFGVRGPMRDELEGALDRLSMHRDGFGFLIPDRPIEGVQGDITSPLPPPRKPCTATACSSASPPGS